jgi:hypothetical protein
VSLLHCRVGGILGIGALFAASLASASDLQLGDNVMWAATAREAVVPAGLDRATAGRYEDDFIFEYRSIAVHFSADTVELKSKRVSRYNSAVGVRDMGNMSISFDARSDLVRIEHALVIDSADNIHVVEPSAVQILPSDTVSAFSDAMYVLVPFQGLDIGSRAILVTTTTTDRDEVVAPWGASYYQQYGVPQEHVEIHISWDAPELEPAWHAELAGMSCKPVGERSVTCAGQDIPAYPLNEEVFYDDVVPQFVVAEQRSWGDIQDWYRPRFEAALSGNSSIAETAARLSEGLETEADILRAFHEFVATKIRYVALEHGENAYAPHSSAVTLERRYGDCEDKAALLVDLLKQVDIRMSPVLVSTTRRSVDKLATPTSRYFDHLIVCGALSNGHEYCLDGTDPYTGIDHLSGWIQGAAALRIDGNPAPHLLPQSDYRWVLRERTDMTLDASGNLEERGEIEYGNALGTSLREGLARLTTEELQDWAVKDYQNTVSDRVEPVFRFDGIDKTDRDVRVEWQTSYDSIVSPDEDLDFAERASWLLPMLRSLHTDNEVYEYRSPGLLFESVISINVHPRWNIAFPGPDIDMRSSFGELKRTYAVEGQTVTATTSFRTTARTVGVDEVDAFNKFLEIVQDESAFRTNGVLAETP